MLCEWCLSMTTKISSTVVPPRKQQTPLVVIILEKGPFSGQGLKQSSTGILSQLEPILRKALEQRIQRENFKVANLTTLTVSSMVGSQFRSLLVVGKHLEQPSKFEELQFYRKLGAIIYEHAKRLRASSVTLATEGLNLSEHSVYRALVEGCALASYTFERYKSKKDGAARFSGIKQLFLYSPKKHTHASAREAQILSDATCFARDLINTPPRDCTTTDLVNTAKDLARTLSLKITVFDKKKLERMGAGGILGVAQGSAQPPYLIKLEYTPTKKPIRTISLIGKGITFDSGGLSIKTASGMETMKADMSGAAAVLGAIKALAEIKVPYAVRGYIPTAENMISGEATRPGDVLRIMNGKTVEVLNTDAEGRLILADALCLAEKDRCDVMVDLATLTGACRIALGSEYAALFATSDELSRALMAAGDLEGERFWPMPLAPEYRDMIKSPIADLKNTGGAYGGAITAALFLKEFVRKTPWAHLDIAGPSFSDSEKGYIKKGGVGFGVRTLARYILNLNPSP